MKPRPRHALAPLKDDIFELADFLFKRTHDARALGWRSRARYGGDKAGEFAVIARLAIKMVSKLDCDCHQLPHRDYCARVHACRYEMHFANRWGVTRKTEIGEIPIEIQNLGRDRLLGSDIIPLPRPG